MLPLPLLRSSHTERPIASAIEASCRLATSSSLATLLRSYAHSESLQEGRIAHHHIFLHPHPHRLLENPFLFNVLLYMYGRCGALDDSVQLFSSDSCPRDVFSWNYVITSCVRHGHGLLARSFFHQMFLEGVLPDMPTYAAVFSTFNTSLSSCLSPSLDEGKFFHACILQYLNLSVSTALMHMYGKCGCLSEAWVVFHNIDAKDVVAWNCILSVCRDGQMEEVMALYEKMELEDVVPDMVTFIALLSICACSFDVISGEKFHGLIVNKGYETDVKVGNAIVNMYAKCGKLEAATSVFDNLINRNLISWNVILKAYAQKSDGPKIILHLLDQMGKEGFHLNKVTFLSISSGCPLQYLFKVFETINEVDVAVWNALISSCICNREDEKGLQLFHQMQEEGFFPNEVTFISVVSVYSCEGSLLEGKHRHAQIVGSRLDFDICVSNALMSMYQKCSSLEDAERTYQKLFERNLVSFTTMISVFMQTRRCSDALELFYQMQWEGSLPDGFTYASALDACANLFVFSKGVDIHSQILSRGFDIDLVLRTSLVNMYSECGNFNDAKYVFEHKLNEQNIVSFNTMISACAHHGQGNEALYYFEVMQKKGIVPDSCTFVSILSSCSHAGLLEQGICQFSLMQHGYHYIPRAEHYDCLIDLVSRAGQLNEAEDLIFNVHKEPSIVSFRTFLGACRHQIDVERAEHIAKQAFDLEPENDGVYLMLANMRFRSNFDV